MVWATRGVLRSAKMITLSRVDSDRAAEYIIALFAGQK